MKKYPCENMEMVDLDTMEPNGLRFAIPTTEAYANFESYLDPDELAFHQKLGFAEKLQLAFSVNPFNALLDMMGKER